MRVQSTPAVAGLLRQRRNDAIRYWIKRLAWKVAYVAIFYIWMTLP